MKEYRTSFGTSGISGGPDWTIHGGEDLTTQLNHCLAAISPAKRPENPHTSFSFVTWGRFYTEGKHEESKVGRCRFHGPSLTFGINIHIGKDIVLASKPVMKLRIAELLTEATRKVVKYAAAKGYADQFEGLPEGVERALRLFAQMPISEFSDSSRVIKAFVRYRDELQAGGLDSCESDGR